MTETAKVADSSIVWGGRSHSTVGRAIIWNGCAGYMAQAMGHITSCLRWLDERWRPLSRTSCGADRYLCLHEVPAPGSV